MREYERVRVWQEHGGGDWLELLPFVMLVFLGMPGLVSMSAHHPHRASDGIVFLA